MTIGEVRSAGALGRVIAIAGYVREVIGRGDYTRRDNLLWGAKGRGHRRNETLRGHWSLQYGTRDIGSQVSELKCLSPKFGGNDVILFV